MATTKAGSRDRVPEAAVGTTPGPEVRLRGVLAVAWLAAFTPILDLDIVTTGLPRIGRAFDAGASDLAWVVNAYIIAFAVSILAVGRLGDAVGRRRVLVGGAALFAFATAGAAVAPTFPVLLAMRALQGLGGSAMLTTSLALVSASFDGPLRARALGLYFSGAALGGVVGPVAGGMLVTAFGWRMMFTLQVPLAAAVAALALAALPEVRGRARGLDVQGLALGTLALLGLNVALLRANEWGWLSAPSAVAWAVGLAGVAGFVARERSARDPAVRLDVFRNRRFVAASIVGAAAWFSILAASVQIPLYLQQGRGLDAAVTGWLLLGWSATAFVAFPRVGRLVPRFGERRLMLAGLALSAATLAALALLDGASPLWLIVPIGVALGVATAATIVPSASAAVAQFPPEEAGTASGVFNSIRQLGSTLGVAAPAAAYDLGAGGRFTGETVFDGTRAAFALAALLVSVAFLGAARLLSEREVESPAARTGAATTVAERARASSQATVSSASRRATPRIARGSIRGA